MRKILFALLIFTTVFGLTYLVGSFISATFDLSKWDSKDRAFIGFLGFLLATMIAGVSLKD